LCLLPTELCLTQFWFSVVTLNFLTFCKLSKNTPITTLHAARAEFFSTFFCLFPIVQLVVSLVDVVERVVERLSINKLKVDSTNANQISTQLSGDSSG